MTGRVCDELELGPLLVFGKHVAFHGGGKSALRTNGELIERQKGGGIVNPAEELLLAFGVGRFELTKPRTTVLFLGA